MQSKKAEIQQLITIANEQIQIHEIDHSYWGTEQDINVTNNFFERVGMLFNIDVAEDDEWGTYLLKATVTESYEFALGRLNTLHIECE